MWQLLYSTVENLHGCSTVINLILYTCSEICLPGDLLKHLNGCTTLYEMFDIFVCDVYLCQLKFIVQVKTCLVFFLRSLKIIADIFILSSLSLKNRKKYSILFKDY